MNEAKKPKPEKIITPKGTMIYLWLNKPDTKWKEEGEYRVELKVDAEAAAPLLKTIDKLYAAAIKKARANPKHKNKKVKEQDKPYTLELDDDGNETGLVLFKFKRRASGVKKDGSPWAIKPDVFNSKGEKLDPAIQVWGGSVGKVSFTAEPYDTPIGAGLSLRLEGVQVIKLVEGSGRSAESYGFGNESDDDDADETDDDESDDADDEDSDAEEGDEF
jgi:hypothetical protein